MKFKKWLTLTNIMAFFMVLLYILDRWIIPIPNNYNGFKWEDIVYESFAGQYGENFQTEMPKEELDIIELAKKIFGYKGGVITNSLAIVDTNINPNGNSLYRYFTMPFTHAHHLHLISNVIAFIIIGNYIEKKFGPYGMLGLFFLTNAFGIPITNMIYSVYSPVTVGASSGIFGLIGVGFIMCLLNKENFKDFSKAKKIYLVIYGVVPTYIISFGWSTVVHNVSFVLGISIGYLLYIIFPKVKEIVQEKTTTEA